LGVVALPPTPWIFSAPHSAAEIAHPPTLPLRCTRRGQAPLRGLRPIGVLVGR